MSPRFEREHVKIAVVSYALPHPEGTSIGRELFAWCEGVVALGHDLQVWAWHSSPNHPSEPLPPWCTYAPFDHYLSPPWLEHLHSLIKPHRGIARAGWAPPEGHIAVAADVSSSGAVVPFAHSVSTVHNRAFLDGFVSRRLNRWSVQEARAERWAARRSQVVVTYSDRVARSLPGKVCVVPMAYPIPPAPLPPIDAPIAYIVADWSWSPNLRTLSTLLAAWESVRELVPGAHLLLGGPLPDHGVGSVPGVKFLGRVGTSAEVLAVASVLAFPCPPSTGPKVKVFEALAYGRPVVTTSWGVEGLLVQEGEGTIVVQARDFANSLAELLRSPERRAALGRAGRAAVQTSHSPLVAARARLDAFADVFGS